MIKIELRKVSHSKSLSEETPAYTAQVWADGVHVCDVSNHGHGGGDMQYPAKGKTHADVAALNERCKAELPKRSFMAGGEKHEFETDLEVACHIELGRIDLAKTVKRDLANKIMFQKADGKIYQVSLKGVPQNQREQLIGIVKQEHGIAKTLNEMTLAEAVAIYEKAA